MICEVLTLAHGALRLDVLPDLGGRIYKVAFAGEDLLRTRARAMLGLQETSSSKGIRSTRWALLAMADQYGLASMAAGMSTSGWLVIDNMPVSGPEPAGSRPSWVSRCCRC